ncbi:hypothetical protein HOY82DRAFT_551210 [Tuber indicum]|nr:hypothetical protein HOY82DRAFT_551210 [Tuber indicum]
MNPSYSVTCSYPNCLPIYPSTHLFTLQDPIYIASIIMFKTPTPRKMPVPDTRIVWPRTTSPENLQGNGWICNCNPRVPAPVRTSNTSKNRGKKFYSCVKGKGNLPCNFFLWVEEAQVVAAAAAPPTTPKYLQSLLSWPTPPSRHVAPSKTRSGTCYAAETTAPALPPSKAPAPAPSPSSSLAKRRRESSPSNEASEQKPSPHKHHRPNRVTKNPYSTNHPSRASTPKPPLPSTPSSRKAAGVTTGTWDHRSIAPPPSETDVDGCGSDNATVTPSLSPNPSPRRRLFTSGNGPTTPPRTAANTRTASRTPGSRTTPFYKGVLSSPGRGVRFDVRTAVSEFVRAEGIDLKGAGDKLWDILEREVKQKEGVCKGREIARTAHQRATAVIAGLNRRIAELEKEMNEVSAANLRSIVAIEDLETRLSNAGLESQASGNWY